MGYDKLISAPGVHPPPTPPVKGGEWREGAKMNCHSVSKDNRNKRPSKEKRRRKKTQYSRQETE
jgi:hypothetical protein